MIVGNEKLYEVYNEFYSLVEEFYKFFDVLVIFVVGYQMDGKSVLVEVLMGFQFNYVGGGIKICRFIMMYMKYNVDCVQFRCFLVFEDQLYCEKEQSFDEIQVLFVFLFFFFCCCFVFMFFDFF